MGKQKRDNNSDIKHKLVFEKKNYIFLAIGFLAVLLGFALMTGASTTMTEYNPDIFSFRRIRLAPFVCLLGFLFMIFAILYKPKKK